MKKLPYKGLFFIIFILLLILFSLVIFKTSYNTYKIHGNCNKFDFRYMIKFKYKNDYKIKNTESEYILTNKDLGVDLKFETLTQRREDYEGINNSFREDQNLKYYKEFKLQNGMTGYAYNYYGDLKIVLNVANANETDDESFLSYIVLNTVLKNENGFEIEDFDNKFNIYYNLIKDINYSVTERY